MEHTSSRDVLEADDGVISEVANGAIDVETGLIPSWLDDPFVVIVFVVVASYLLLLGTDGEHLDVRVEESTAIADVFECNLRAEGDL